MKVNRLVSIIMILIDKKRISAKKLADMFEVSTRTIYRDIEAISMAGIPVHSTTGVGGGFEIMENYKIDKNTFSQAELITLLIGISSIPNDIKSKDFTNTLAKIKSLIPIDKVETTNLQTEQIHIDFSHWTGNRNLENDLSTIKIALQENSVLSFEYLNHRGNKTKRQVEPYQLVLKSSQWYFQGYCYKRNDFRLFKLTRLFNLKREKITFIPKKYQQPLLDTTKIMSKLQVTIKLRIHQSIMEQLLDYCDYDSFLKDDENHYIVNFPFIENDYHYGILLSFADRCECLAPLHIRTELKRKIANLYQIYEI
ncbi:MULTISPECIES: YafY family protein [unclassified Enterococcus]|uniref:helix-turn-helix transcriptional regulator n=1 Tax=unclassified Enterococcus TaxID=2608891 RepID=UPI0015563912|nr:MULTISPECIES: YafY family protein [unclassified Enterococcus]MBS7577916.1 YafY family transcriptional regulator [Enterococcus sp. MMGLQ5-2]MBS7585223.1 YafY family transcriptional regulator [Enterococcus sp. MMGLQ5-1]NPD13080.1 YafY family transcriptional regulator [Enterococcus sp. MMGLQ5-1]NPD37746.1 YafY family transcriptional regulator [Enterococcus sp. MMGLQ5-2]